MNEKEKLFLQGVSAFLAAVMIVNPAGMTVYAGETGTIIEKEEADRELAYAEAETSYKLYNNKTYEIINTTGQDIEIKDDTGLRKYFECAKYESDGTCTYVGLECYNLPKINNGSQKEEREVVTVVNKEAGAGYYATITVPENVTVKEIEQPALYHYTLNNHESCVITNPTKMNLPITDNIGIEYVKYDANGKCNQYNIKSYEVASLAAGENEKEVQK